MDVEEHRMAALTLYELNSLIHEGLDRTFPLPVWLCAEINDVRTMTGGHCSLEFIQKDEQSDRLLAKMRGMIWRSQYMLLKSKFEMETRQAFSSGLKVLVKVQVGFHQLYGLSLTVQDIDPSYTLGDLQRQREQILEQLRRDGVLDMNKALEFPLLPRRIAVISSPTAAGYQDFQNQLHGNAGGYDFHTELFPSVMQGNGVEASLLAQLDRIFERKDAFDCVVIIRGGGASTDLHGFDTYALASAVAQFPLPVITGIGHERDNTVLDMVAAVRVKTPTAAAEFLISKMDAQAQRLQSLSEMLVSASRRRIQDARTRLREHVMRLQPACMKRLSVARNQISLDRTRLQTVSLKRCARARQELDLVSDRIPRRALEQVASRRHALDLVSQHLFDVSPQRILDKGYSVTLLEGKVLKDAGGAGKGDVLEIRLKTGTLSAEVR